MTLFKQWLLTNRYELHFPPAHGAAAVIEAGFVGELHINVDTFLGSICSHVTRERSYFPPGIQNICISGEKFSRVENVSLFSFGNSSICSVDGLR